MKERERRHAAFPGVPLVGRTWRFCLQAGLHPWGALVPYGSWTALPRGAEPAHQAGEQSTLRATSPHLGPQISGQETYSSCGEALILDNSNSDWTGALEALRVIKEEAPLDKPGPFLPETPQDGQQRPPDFLAFPGPGQSSVPLKDKRRHGFALW